VGWAGQDDGDIGQPGQPGDESGDHARQYTTARAGKSGGLGRGSGREGGSQLVSESAFQLVSAQPAVGTSADLFMWGGTG
jgi:hypothetical protein